MTDGSSPSERSLRAALDCQRELEDERWSGWKALDAAAWRAAELRFAAIERLHGSACQGIDRRLDELARAQAELGLRCGEFLPVAIHTKDMERLYNERQQQNATATQARLQAEQTATTNRRTMFATLVAASISILSVLVSVMLHFLDSLRSH